MANSAVSVDWTTLKNSSNSRNIPTQWININDLYYIWLFEGSLELICTIPVVTPTPGGSDQEDFETNYKSLGNIPYRSGLYATPVNIRQTAGTAANATVWSMRNPVGSGKTIFIERVNLIMSFDSATPLGRSLLRYNLLGFGGATPTGGTAQSTAKLDSTNSASIGPDIRFLDTGLTTTSVNFGNTILTFGCPAVEGAATSYLKNKDNYVAKLYPGEGFCIRLAVTAVAGQGLTGEIVWSER